MVVVVIRFVITAVFHSFIVAFVTACVFVVVFVVVVVESMPLYEVCEPPLCVFLVGIKYAD